MAIADEGGLEGSPETSYAPSTLDNVEECILGAKSEDEVKNCVALLDEYDTIGMDA